MCFPIWVWHISPGHLTLTHSQLWHSAPGKRHRSIAPKEILSANFIITSGVYLGSKALLGHCGESVEVWEECEVSQGEARSAKFLIFPSRQGLWVFVTLLHTFALHSSTLTLAFGLKNFNGFGIWAVDCACLLREGFNKKNDGYQTTSPGTSTHWTNFFPL